MELNERKQKRKKAVSMLNIMLIAVIIVFTVMSAVHVVRYKDYEEVQAEITNVKLPYGSDEDDLFRILSLFYLYDGKWYSSNMTVPSAITFGMKRGTEFTIRCNPDDPQMLDNVYDLYGYIFFDVIAAAALIIVNIPKRTKRIEGES